MQGWLNVICTLLRAGFHCLRLDNWHAVVVVVNLRMFLVSLDYNEQFYIWFLGSI